MACGCSKVVKKASPYRRYHIETKKAPNITAHPHRFKVKINRFRLASLLLKEAYQYRGHKEVILSRPCVYGVFSGPLGGFAPRESLCVGCLRCTTQYPEIAKILLNPKFRQLGDPYFTFEQVDTIVHESEHGRVPIKGAGYRGKFGGNDWDAMWTDMSEIVRPTRDGIHGREFISTEIDIGEALPFLPLDKDHQLIGKIPKNISIPIPFIFDLPPEFVQFNHALCLILSRAANEIGTLALFPVEIVMKFSLFDQNIIPVIAPPDLEILQKMNFSPAMLEMDGWNETLYNELSLRFPNSSLLLRTDFQEVDPLICYKAGIRIFHFTADYHGRNKNGRFVKDLIHEAHLAFVNAGCRDEVTLIGSGGIVAAEHVPKAIICGLDAVAIDTPLMAALQAKFAGKCINRHESCFKLPKDLPVHWGVQRLKNLIGSWRDQLLEILGAMGLRELRRMRGEMGRALFQKMLEDEAFAGIDGYESQ